MEKLALESEGKTIEELKRTITLAKQESFTSHQPVTEETLQKAFNQQIHKMIYAQLPHRLPYPKEQIKQLAAFQAGKALTISYSNTNLHIAQATVLRISKKFHEESMWNKSTLGDRKQKPKDWNKHGQVFTYHSQDALPLETHEELINAIKIKLAGHIAQEIVCGTQSANYRANAKNEAYKLARKVIFAGVDETVLPKNVINELKQATHALVKKCENEVRALLVDHKDNLLALTEKLVKEQIVTGQAITKLISAKTQESATTDDQTE